MHYSVKIAWISLCTDANKQKYRKKCFFRTMEKTYHVFFKMNTSSYTIKKVII